MDESEFVTRFKVDGKEKQLDYNALANKPEIPANTDTTYTLTLNDTTLTLTDSNGKAQNVDFSEWVNSMLSKEF